MSEHLSCLTRRNLLLFGAGLAVTVSAVGPGVAFAGDRYALRKVRYPRRRIGSLAEIRVGAPLSFRYPVDEPHCQSFLARLGARAAGGIGPEQDIVAFNAACTHMGMPLLPNPNPEWRVAGPCALHLTTFDLTRHGLVLAGHATESLPQIELELDGDDIVAAGIMGLVYGYSINPPARA